MSDVEEAGKYPNSFSVTPAPTAQKEGKERQYWLRAETAQEKKEWLLYIVRAVGGVASGQAAPEADKFVLSGDDVAASLTRLYHQRIEAIEKRFQYDEFFGAPLKRADFDALPQVLLLGQYSVGKTSTIEYLLGRPYPGSRIGPEPTTDRFTALLYGDEREIPGHALTVDPDRPFGSCAQFGAGFLGRFEGAQCPSDVLRKVTVRPLSPHLPSPAPRSLTLQACCQVRSSGVVSMISSRSSSTLPKRRTLSFSSSTPTRSSPSRPSSSHGLFQLDISDEFRDVIAALGPNADKVSPLPTLALSDPSRCACC